MTVEDIFRHFPLAKLFEYSNFILMRMIFTLFSSFPTAKRN